MIITESIEKFKSNHLSTSIMGQKHTNQTMFLSKVQNSSMETVYVVSFAKSLASNIISKRINKKIKISQAKSGTPTRKGVPKF